MAMHLLESNRREIEAKARLVKTNRILLTAGEVVHIGHWELDCATRLCSWSDEVYRILGRARGASPPSLEEAIACYHPDDRETIGRLVAEAMRNGAAFSFELRILRPDGETREVAGWGQPDFAPDGTVVSMFGYFKDITEHKNGLREQMRLRLAAERASQAKSTFLATMSHEIRTPMNGVMGMNALLLETPLSPHQRKLAETIHYSATALLAIIGDILDVSKLEAGKLELEAADFNLAALLEKVIECLSGDAEKKGLALSADIAVTGTFHGDPTRFRQILMNLVSNAIKFTEQGWVRVILQGMQVDPGRTRIHVEVQDTGIGIREAAKPNLFTPFEQEDASIMRRFGGSGLGLSICKRLVDLMGGQIGMTDRPGGGSVFWFDVVLNRAIRVAEDNVRKGLEQVARSAPPGSGRILLAEDNDINAELARLILEGAGFSVDTARDGREAVEAMRRHAYELVFMDMQMPVLDGLSATRQIRALPGANGQVPIVAMTANAMSDDRQKCLDAGMDGYLTKPVDPAVLRDAANSWIASLAGAQHAPEAHSFTQFPFVDQAVLEALRAALPGSKFVDVLLRYIEAAESQAQQLRLWRDAGSCAHIGEEAHRLKGAAGVFGAKRVQALAAELETVCLKGWQDAVPDLIDHLVNASAETTLQLHQALAAQPPPA
jgi:two-component system sensor histidine kinase/response regulator